MVTQNKYQTGPALRRVLEDRLLQISEKEQIDLQRLRRQVAFDRLLARLFQKENHSWALKGGYAMELRLKNARATRDIDLTLRSLASVPKDKTKKNAFYQGELQKAADLDLGDHFQFIIGNAQMDLDAAPEGGARFPVETKMDKRTFIKFHLDIGAGDFPMDPLEKMMGRDWLGFAGIPPKEIWSIPKEQQFAEKLHAYTRPRTQLNSRTRDLVDIVLLIDSQKLETVRVIEAIKKTFERRKTHALPDTIESPPADWVNRFSVLAKECGLPHDIDEAFKLLQSYFAAINGGK